MIKVIYNKVCGRCVQSEPLTSGMVGQTIHFEYSHDFDGLAVTAVFTDGKNTVDVVNPGNECIIPHEVLTTVGAIVKVGIYAVRGNELVIPTVYAHIGVVQKGADPSGDVSADPTLPVWAQTQALIGNLSQIETETKDSLVAAINEVKQTADTKQDKLIAGDNITIAADGKTISATGGGGGISTTAKNLLITILRSGVYTYDQSNNITALDTALGGGTTEPEEPDVPVETTYAISNELINCTSSNSATSAKENAAYSTTLTANDGYTLTGGTVTITMGGVDITSTAYADGVISIAAVTGNVEIVASAIETEVTEALNTNGLVFNYDFRNSAMELYNLSGWGNVYRTVDKTGNALIFGTTEATGDDKGLKDYNFRGNRLVSSEAKNVELGETYTAQALFRTGDKRLQPNLFGWGENAVGTNRFKISPKYLVGTTETSTTGVLYSREDTQYIVITYVVSGKSLTVYYNTDLVLTLDGNNYDNFTKWMDYGVPNSVYNKGYITAFVGYNRALTQSEIVNNIAFFKTLEVTA